MTPLRVYRRLVLLAVPILGMTGCAATPSAGTATSSAALQRTAPADPPPSAVADVLGRRLDAMLAAQALGPSRLAAATPLRTSP